MSVLTIPVAELAPHRFGENVTLWAAMTIGMAWVVFIISVIVRRLHDINTSGWWILLLAIPALNVLFILALALCPGDYGENDYGSAPPLNPTALNIMAVVVIVLYVVSTIVAVTDYIKDYMRNPFS